MDAIVAVYSDWGIGDGRTQPIVIPEDRKHFVGITRGAAVIVGRKTLEDFPGGRPLPNRVNILMTRREADIPGVVVAHTTDDALREAEKHERVLVLGGESVFRQFMPHLERVYVTKLDVCPHSTAFFADLDAAPDWVCSDAGEPLVSESGIGYRFCTYERVK